MELIAEIRQIYDNYDFDTEILAASIRTVNHVKQAALIGADVATVPPSTLKSLVKHPSPTRGSNIHGRLGQDRAVDWLTTTSIRRRSQPRSWTRSIGGQASSPSPAGSKGSI